MLKGQIVLLPLSAASSKMEAAHRQNDSQRQGVTEINPDEHYSDVTAGMPMGADPQVRNRKIVLSLWTWFVVP